MSELNRIMQQVQDSPYAVNLLNGIMLVLLTWSLAQWTWMLGGFDSSPVLPGRLSTGKAVPTVSFNIDDLTRTHLFGKADAGEVSHEDIPISSLNLKLTGIVASDRGGFALISVNGQEQTPFFVGENVVGNAVLDTVLTDRVILQRGSVKESLLLSDDFDSSGLPGINTTAGPGLHAVKPEITQLTNNRFSVQRNDVTKQLERPDFLRQALIVPYKKGGFIVRHMQKGSLYEDLGLKKNDVIKNVNGNAVNNMNDVMALYKMIENIDSVPSVRIEVMRNGQSQMLEYQLN